MSIKAISFDAAGTLFDVRWNAAAFAVECAEACGIDVPEFAGDRYRDMMAQRWTAYVELNLSKNAAVLDGWWDQLTKEWLDALGFAGADVASVQALARETLYSKGSGLFSVFPDVLPALQALKGRFRLCILSNWDYSLHRFVRIHGLDAYFEIVIASLEVGPEKPDPRLFQYMLAQLGLGAEEVIHVGDDAIDDLKGAKDAGLKGLLIDRSQAAPSPPYIASLTQLAEHPWIA